MKKPCKQGCTNGMLNYGPGLNFECICAKRARAKAIKAALNRGAIVGAAHVPSPPNTPWDYSQDSLQSLCRTIRRNWPAMPACAAMYFEPLASLESLEQDYGADSGRSMALYFLANAAGWKGDVARAVKKELNKRLKEGGRHA